MKRRQVRGVTDRALVTVLRHQQWLLERLGRAVLAGLAWLIVLTGVVVYEVVVR